MLRAARYGLFRSCARPAQAGRSQPSMVVLVDYGLGNLRSALVKFARLGIGARISEGPAGFEAADKLVLAGIRGA